MKKIIITFLFFSAIALACHKKAVPEISSRTSFPQAPKSSRLPYDDKPESIAAGKIIFETECKSCHELKDTKLYTTDRWTSILRVMILRAGLSQEKAREVTSYVMANAKK